ncbi:hypothetical protein ALC57_10778 [Trachymyrmex cornetzi]|uniref:Uncharacterized protein n=1 Tax=Trachymyrmex cornetzi TaxID=471704 RepID=A0A151J3C9_9HYME|nr:hypothetical protein ALC57_10778 [Trachymyrmex cornetzi]
MKGENLHRELCIFGSRVKLRVRPYIQSVRQHGVYEAEIYCRNCGGAHRLTFRHCPVLEKNRNINIIIAIFPFVKRGSILKGREDAVTEPVYDRYERPERWPSIPSRGVVSKKFERRNE